jgi:hypothetical protein
LRFLHLTVNNAIYELIYADSQLSRAKGWGYSAFHNKEFARYFSIRVICKTIWKTTLIDRGYGNYGSE